MNPLFIIIGIAVVGVLGLIALGVNWARSQPTASIEDRLADFGTLDQPMSLEEIEMSQPFIERIIIPNLKKLAQAATQFTPKETLAKVERQLELAGRPYDLKATGFMTLRIAMTAILGGLGFALFIFMQRWTFMQRVLLGGVVAGAGYFLPVLWLQSQISKRQKEIIKSLPDALDLLTICVEAGLGFDAAMAKVAEKWDNELSHEFSRVIQEIQLGKLRREALRDMANRIEVSDVSTFVAAIIQAENLGVSIARVLRIQSDQMRMRRRQRAEELARAATLKILPPVAFLIFPSIFVVLLGPAVIQVMTLEIPIFSFGGGGLP